MKYVIEFYDEPIAPGLYRAKGFNTLIFDHEGFKRLKEYEDPGIKIRGLKGLAANALSQLFEQSKTGQKVLSLSDKEKVDMAVTYHKLISEILAYDE